MNKAEKKVLDDIISDVHDPISGKIKILQDVQDRYECLKDEHMRYIAERIGTSYTDIYGIATFYSQFNLSPPGKHTISICQGTACHVKGGKKILKKLNELLGIRVGGTTKDGRFSLKAVRCLGCCGLAPVIVVDDETFGRVKPSQLEEILDKFE